MEFSVNKVVRPVPLRYAVSIISRSESPQYITPAESHIRLLNRTQTWNFNSYKNGKIKRLVKTANGAVRPYVLLSVFIVTTQCGSFLDFTRYSDDIFECGGQVQKQVCGIYLFIST